MYIMKYKDQSLTCSEVRLLLMVKVKIVCGNHGFAFDKSQKQ